MPSRSPFGVAFPSFPSRCGTLPSRSPDRLAPARGAVRQRFRTSLARRVAIRSVAAGVLPCRCRRGGRVHRSLASFLAVAGRRACIEGTRARCPSPSLERTPAPAAPGCAAPTCAGPTPRLNAGLAEIQGFAQGTSAGQRGGLPTADRALHLSWASRAVLRGPPRDGPLPALSLQGLTAMTLGQISPAAPLSLLPSPRGRWLEPQGLDGSPLRPLRPSPALRHTRTLSLALRRTGAIASDLTLLGFFPFRRP